MIKFIPLHRVALGVLTAALVACDPGTSAPTPLPVVPDVIADGGSCPEPTGPGTQHSTSVTTNEVWTAAESPHFVTTSIDVVADLTLEPCALVVLSRGVGMTVDGTLTAQGELIDLTPSDDSDDAFDIRPVVFTSTSDDPADNWGTLTVEPLGRVNLEVTALIHAAHPDAAQNGGGALLVRGTNDSTVTKSVRAVLQFVLESGGYGVNLQVGGAFTDDSLGVLVEGAATNPVFTFLPGIGSIPEGFYTGNGTDEILIDTRLPIESDETFRNRGVPYAFDSASAYVAPANPGDPAVTLTVEAGVTVKMRGNLYFGDAGGTLNERQARLVAQGTAAQPITFTSAEVAPEKGDWGSLYFEAIAPTGNALEHAVIEYAGGDSQTSSYGCGALDNDGALLFVGNRPAEAFVTSTTFRHNAGETTIVSGWVSDETGPDFVTGNVFTDTAGVEGQASCIQSLWRTTDTLYCPDTMEPDCFQ